MPPESLHFEALGTTCSLFAVGLSQDRLRDGESWVHEVGARLTRFSADSELSRLNAAHGFWAEVSADTEAVLRQALVAYETSYGLVNAAVLPSMRAIGYVQSMAAGPGAVMLDAATPVPPLTDVLEVEPGRARVRDGAGIDLGGIAKGWMADRLSEQLGDNVLANIGGDLRARGRGPAGEGWPVGFAGTTVLLRDQGAATSSIRKRRWGDVHHLIDPRTGRPARTGLVEVSVVAETGFAAEVAAKTALLLGREIAPAYCAANALAWWLSDGDDS